MVILLIAGPSGGGKSTLAEKLRLGFEGLDVSVDVLKMDNYYKINDETNPRQNFDTPDAIDMSLLVEHLRQLQLGQSVESPLYSMEIKNRLAQTTLLNPTDVLIVEGIFALKIIDELETSDKLGIYIQPDSYQANIERRASRDINERHTSIEETKRRELKSFVRDGFFNYIARTINRADIVISNNHIEDISTGVDEIMTFYKERFHQLDQASIS